MNRCKIVCLLLVSLLSVAFNSHAAETGRVNLVEPIVPPAAQEAVVDSKGKRICEDSFVLQKKGQCCPEGTNNDVWPNACTPVGTIDDQIFNFDAVPHYCPSSNMYIVSDKNWKWFSCADSSSIPMYPAAKNSEGAKFCREHGYATLMKIKPWGSVGCVKVGDSQGDGCIEAGTCSFKGK